ncbi:hypothetical protein [Streptomyces phaeochromogenes]|uniref:hypothetical protein n=1 Tax=Streptomyces phaeochromogenes TaxID=1923 RepID=UPI0038660C37|nr:hypothetical protein OG277_15735 [Streptomyces phaeochromogenes]
METESARSVNGRLDGAAALLKVPAVPLHGADGTRRAGEGPGGMTEPTRLLCAAAHLRPDRAEELAEKLRKWRKEQAKQLGDRLTPKKVRQRRLEQAAKRALKGEKAKLERAWDDEEPADPKQPRVLVGHEYVRWVRSRIAGDGRPVPSQGFELEPVLAACAQAERLLLLRRALAVLACGAGGLWVLTPLACLAPVVSLSGLWAAFYTDRVLAQRRLHAVIRADESDTWGAEVPRRFRSAVERIRDGAYGEVVPYQNQIRSSGAKYHFVGAGKVWFETQIGIDVMSAKSEDENDGQDPADGNSRLRSLPSVEELLAGSRPGEGVVRFTPDDLHAHVARELQRPIKPLPDFHPDSEQEVFGVAAIAADRWGTLNPERWEGLVTLARDGVRAAGAHSAPKVARRFLCARMTSWDGELVASLFVGFAYENHYLRVVVRPHVVNPIHPGLRNAETEAASEGWSRRRRAAYLAAVDTGWALIRMVKRAKNDKKNPTQDPGKGPVSLREVYSTRYMDDMLQYDDARRYIEMMQGRVLAAVEGFLVDHNVDTVAYKEQITVVLNNGIINTGEMSNVQNQPGAVGSQQSAGGAT